MAKLLLILLLVVLVGCWIARARAQRAPREKGRRGAAPRAEEIVACAHCGLHLPRGEAVRGAAGYYCSEGHRLAQGDRA